MVKNLCSLTAEQIVRGVMNQEFSAEEYISQILERIEKVDDKINAFIIVDGNGALEKARLIDKKVRNGEHAKDLGSLAGVAIGIKDNICTKGLRTTCASKMLQVCMAQLAIHGIQAMFLEVHQAAAAQALQHQNVLSHLALILEDR